MNKTKIEIGDIVKVKYLDHATFSDIEIDNPKYYGSVILVTFGELLHENDLYVFVASDYNEKIECYESRKKPEGREGRIHLILKSCILEMKKLDEI